MRALIVHPGASFSVSDVFTGWRDGLRANGVQVASLNLDDRLSFYGVAKVKMQRNRRYRTAFSPADAVRMAAIGLKAAVYDWWPDVIVIISAFFVPTDFYEVFRGRGHKVVIVHTEEPYEYDREIERAQYAHLNIINDPTHLEAFQAVAPTIYSPHGYDPRRHHPRPTDPEIASDFCFVGTGYPSRVSFLEQVDFEGISTTLAGNWESLDADSRLRSFLAHPIDECCPNEETVKLYTSSKVSANLYRKEAQRPELNAGWSLTPREVELAACGVPFLREPRGEGDVVLSMLPTFETPADFSERLRWYLANDAVRERHSVQIQEAVSDRTFTTNVAKALRALESAPSLQRA